MSIDMIRQIAVPILIKYGVVKAFIFGSYSRGEQNEESDIDILIDYGTGVSMSLFHRINLKLDLEEAFGKKVDVLTKEAISPYMIEYVMKEKRVIM